MRVSLSTHAPLTLPGMLSTSGHWAQSSDVITCTSSLAEFKPSCPCLTSFQGRPAGGSLRKHGQNQDERDIWTFFWYPLVLMLIYLVHGLRNTGQHGEQL